MSRAPRNSAVSRNFVHPKSKIPVTVTFIFHTCTLRACSDLQVESYRVAGPLVDTLYRILGVERARGGCRRERVERACIDTGQPAVGGLLIVAGVTAIKQSLSLPKAD